MSTAATLAIKVVSDSRQASGDLSRSGAAVSRWGDRAAKVGRFAGRALAVGIGAAAAAAVKFTQAAADDAASAQKLADALKQTTGATDEQVKSVENWITAQGKQLGVADDELRPALTRLATVTGSVSKAQRLATLAMNIAARTGKPLKTVVEGLAKAQTGSITGLAKFGVQVKDSAGKTKDLDKVMRDLSKTYAGAAAKSADTAAGRQKRLSVAMGELQEKIGAKLLPVLEKLTTAGFKVIDWIDRNQKTAGVLVVALGSLLAVTWATSKAIAAWTAITKIASAAQKIWTAVQWAFNAAMSANPIGLIVLAVAALIAGIIIAYKKSDTFRALVQRVGQIGATAIGWVVDKVRVLIRWLSDVLTWVKSKIPGGFSTMKTLAVLYIGLVTAPIRILFSLIQNVFTWVKDKLPGAFEGLKNKITSIGSKLLSPFRTLWNLLQDIWDKIQSILDKAKSLPSPTDSGSAFTGNHSLSDLFRPTVAPAPPPPVDSTTMNLTVQVEGSIIGTTDERVGQELLTAINRGLRVVGREPIGT